MDIAVVIPAKNEEKTIGAVIEETRDELEERNVEPEFIVVSSSSDRTEEIAAEKGANVLKDGGTGLGEAMYRGLKKSLDLEPDLIMSIDADHQFQPDQIGRLLDARGDADLVLGSRFLDSGVKYDMRLLHRAGNRFLTFLVNSATGLSLTDAQTGYRLMKPEIARELRMMGRHTYVQETIIDANRNGYSIKEVAVEFQSREEGGSRVVSSIYRYAVRMFPVILHRAGCTPYLTSAAAIIGAILAAAVTVYGVTEPSVEAVALAAILGLISLQIFFFGMYLDSELP